MKNKNYILRGTSFLILSCLIGVSIFIYNDIPYKTKSTYKIAHISIDDVYSCLYDLIKNEQNYNNIFEQSFFEKLKSLHEDYDAIFSLYVFEKTDSFNIRKVPIKYKNDFIRNASWLKFGYHSESPDFNKKIQSEHFEKSLNEVYTSITNWAGEENLTSYLRLHYFYADSNMMTIMKEKSVNGLLSADDKRISYNLSTHLNDSLFESGFLEYENMRFFKTDLRIEAMRFFPLELIECQDQDTIIIFTHEWALNFLNSWKFEQCIKWLSENKYKFTCLENG